MPVRHKKKQKDKSKIPPTHDLEDDRTHDLEGGRENPDLAAGESCS